MEKNTLLTCIILQHLEESAPFMLSAPIKISLLVLMIAIVVASDCKQVDKKKIKKNAIIMALVLFEQTRIPEKLIYVQMMTIDVFIYAVLILINYLYTI